MRTVQRTLPIVLTALAILGIVAVAGYARKPIPSVPTADVSGGIDGHGDPAQIRIEFVDPELLEYVYSDDTEPSDSYNQGPTFASNPDNRPSLHTVMIVAGPDKALVYYYCTHISHKFSGDICTEPDAHYDYYYCLRIRGGVSPKKGVSDLNHLTFPVGSPWDISQKKDPQGIVATGTVSMEVKYDLTQ